MDRPIRQRIDPTVIHNTPVLNGDYPMHVIKLDIVCIKITVELHDLTADIEGSIDGRTWFSIADDATSEVSYGVGAEDHLVKHIRITRSMGEGTAVVIGV